VAILSVQSHVAYGRVGNRAAVFPLERMGFEVWPINTVQLSNHRGYDSCAGEAFSASQLELVWGGVKDRGALGSCQAVLSGYLGSAEIGAFVLGAVQDVKAESPGAVYCCDPVMGDYGKGVYVDEGIPSFIRESAIPSCDIATPNQFEAELLVDAPIEDADDAKRACDLLRSKGPSIVLITSYEPKDLGEGCVAMFLASDDGYRVIETPELSSDPPLRGTGDLCAALFLGRYLATGDPVAALELACSSLYSVVERTAASGSAELLIVESQGEIAAPERRFEAGRV
jgi:pyridoxine kinase